MSFQPLIPQSGYGGWAFLKRTRAAQQAVFDKSAAVARETAHFKERIGAVKTAEALVGDRRLLAVALGAFGLDGDIDSKFLIRKVLRDGSLDAGDLANRMADKRYLELTRAFGFGDFPTPSTGMSDFGDRIVSAYKARQFEIAVGEQDADLRMALGLGRDLAAILKRPSTDDGHWFAVMGNKPVRTVFEKALGLPTSLARLDLDRQLASFRQAAERTFGDGEVTAFQTPEAQEKLIRLFLTRSQASAAQTGSGQIALSLLQPLPRRG